MFDNDLQSTLHMVRRQLLYFTDASVFSKKAGLMPVSKINRSNALKVFDVANVLV